MNVAASQSPDCFACECLCTSSGRHPEFSYWNYRTCNCRIALYSCRFDNPSCRSHSLASELRAAFTNCPPSLDRAIWPGHSGSTLQRRSNCDCVVVVQAGGFCRSGLFSHCRRVFATIDWLRTASLQVTEEEQFVARSAHQWILHTDFAGRRNFRTVKEISRVHRAVSKELERGSMKSLLPDLLIALTTPPALLPYSAEYAFVGTENSRIASTPMFTPGRYPGCYWIGHSRQGRPRERRSHSGGRRIRTSSPQGLCLERILAGPCLQLIRRTAV